MKKNVLKVIIATLIFIGALLIPNSISWLKLLFYLTSYLIIGSEIIYKSLKNLKQGQIFDEYFLMSLATIGAFLIKEYSEAVVVMILYQVGELFQDYALDKSRKSIAELMDIKPEYANLLQDGQVITVNPKNVQVGDTIIIKPGEKIPLDGTIIKGRTHLNMKSLTGEAMPKYQKENDYVLSGSINLDATITVKVTKEYANSTVCKILDLVENATANKSPSENFISKFAKIYTPTVVIIAALLVVIPLIIYHELNPWLYRSLSFLVVSCPCALVISIPLTFFGGLGKSSKENILIKGSNYLEKLAHARILVCDKTGTLTTGTFTLAKIYSETMNPEELLKYAAHAEYYSNHPLALSIKKAYCLPINPEIIGKVQEIPGSGIKASVNHKNVLIGNAKFMQKNKIKFTPALDAGTILYIAISNKYQGYLSIGDEIKANAASSLNLLRAHGLKKIIMLTGDKETSAQNTSAQLNIDEYYAELLPQDKVNILQKLLTPNPKDVLLFVGDGINDAPVLALADVGISMGNIGSDAAIEASDVVLMTDDLSLIDKAITIAQKTLKIVHQNIFLILLVKITVLLLSAFGLTSMWTAVVADVGILILTIFNALRLFR